MSRRYYPFFAALRYKYRRMFHQRWTLATVARPRDDPGRARELCIQMSGIDLLDKHSQQHLRTWHKRIRPKEWSVEKLEEDFIACFKAIEAEKREDMVKIEARAMLDDWRLEYENKANTGQDGKSDDSTVKSNSSI